MVLFLETAAIDEAMFGGVLTEGILGGLLAFIVGMLVIFLVIIIAIYIYTSLAFMKIAKKTGTEPAGIAWIPMIGPALLSSKIAKMH